MAQGISNVKKVMVLRHSKAEPRTGTKQDFSRKLSKRGRSDAASVGKWLQGKAGKPDLLIASAALRARETATIVGNALDLPESKRRFSKKLFAASPQDWIGYVCKLGASTETVLLVGHNPELEDLIRLLSGANIELNTSGLAVLAHEGSWSTLAEGSCRIEEHVRPDRTELKPVAVSPQNRELSWLAFNERVLQEAADPSVPPLTRLLFLGIVSSNLDEFYRVRVGALEQILSLGRMPPARKDDLKLVIDAVSQRTASMQRKLEHTLTIIRRLLASKHRLTLIEEADLTAAERDFCRAYCAENIRPGMTVLTNWEPQALAKVLETDAVYLIVTMRSAKRRIARALIRLPTRRAPRFIELPPEPKKARGRRVAWLDDVIRSSLVDIFGPLGYEKFEAHAIKLTRSAEIDADNDLLSNYVESLANSLKQRDSSNFVRVIHDEDMPAKTLRILLRQLPLADVCTIIPAGRYHSLRDLRNFPHPQGRQALSAQRLKPVGHAQLSRAASLMQCCLNRDQLLHFPYHSFKLLLQLLREASIDPSVTAISITAYRLAPQSQVVDALINARRNGKMVLVVIEIKARFDEVHNIKWAQQLEAAGIQVHYGLAGYKTHAKLLLISRSAPGGKTAELAGVGTGNLNEYTAQLYEDLFLLTSNPRTVAEVREVFDFLRDPTRIPRFSQLLVSPRDMRDKLIGLVDAEAASAAAGKKAHIRLKLNNLIDAELVRHLEQAASAGAKVDLIIRGVCGINPELKHFGNRISAISIIDSLLEHARIMAFENNGDPLVYIGSADWMQRNLDRRVEVHAPVLDTGLRNELLDILDLQIADNVKARVLNAAQNNLLAKRTGRACRSQADTYAYYRRIWERDAA